MHSEAEDELDEGIVFYEARRDGLGLEFLSEVEDVFARIQENPALGSPYKSTTFRFLLIHRFPYVVFYAEKREFIWVVAIAHGRRRPGYWKRRKTE